MWERDLPCIFFFFFFFFFLGSPLFVTEVERPDLLIRGLTRLVRKKRRKPTPAKTRVGVLNSALLFWYIQTISRFRARELEEKPFCLEQKKRYGCICFSFRRRKAMCVKSATAFLQLFFHPFCPKGPSLWAQTPSLLGSPKEGETHFLVILPRVSRKKSGKSEVFPSNFFVRWGAKQG